MGRIKTLQIKRAGQDLLSLNRERFGRDFTKNKRLVTELLNLSSKRTENKLAGYITHIVKKNHLNKKYTAPIQKEDKRRGRQRR
ncbi:MAG: 30S ribosomal protein S17e [Candidatus Aenigmarchaeota archaeon]|nr:30S ribosomal protein S17e [Candidatus Aenigmarchaeota archaeon]